MRTPSAVERRGKIIGTTVVITPFPALVSTLRGSEDFDSENLTAFELGYRLQPSETTSIDSP